MLEDTKNTIQHVGLNNMQRQEIAERQTVKSQLITVYVQP